VVEGQTEETYVRDTLAMHLGLFGHVVDVRCVMTSRNKAHFRRGGLVSYAKAKMDLQFWMREDRSDDVAFTTMFDMYGLPQDFPGFDGYSSITNPYERAQNIERALAEDIGDHRLIPYVQLHEFEAILFSDIRQMEWAFIDHEKEIQSLEEIASQFGNPELIDDGVLTAPSKRIIAAIPEYVGQKVTSGAQVARKIPIATVRSKCPHFHEWLSLLEQARPTFEYDT